MSSESVCVRVLQAGNRRVGSVRPVAEGGGAHAKAGRQVELFNEGRPLQASGSARDKNGQHSLGHVAEKHAFKEEDESPAEGNS